MHYSEYLARDFTALESLVCIFAILASWVWTWYVARSFLRQFKKEIDAMGDRTEAFEGETDAFERRTDAFERKTEGG